MSRSDKIKQHKEKRKRKEKERKGISKKKHKAFFKDHLNRMIMHFLQATIPFLFYISLYLITETISRPVETSSVSSYTIRWHKSKENDTFFDPRRPPPVYLRSTSSKKPPPSDSFTRNFRIAALVTAGIALTLGLLRLCMMFCHRSSRVPHHRRMSIIRPQIATIESHSFKPDLPPAYLDAIAQGDIDGNKLPSYDEVQDEQMSTRV